MDDLDAEDELLFGLSSDAWKATWIVISIVFWSLCVYAAGWVVAWWRSLA